MKAINIILIVLVLSLVSVSAVDYIPHKINEDFNLIISSNNATSCNFTYIQYPNGSHRNYNLEMSKSGTDYNYTIKGANFSKVGTSCMGITCHDGVKYATGSVCRRVSYDGLEKPDGITIIFFFIISLAVFIFLIWSLFAILKDLANVSTNMRTVFWGFSAYICNLMLYYFIINYMPLRFIETLSLYSLGVFGMTHLFLPLIAMVFTWLKRGKAE